MHNQAVFDAWSTWFALLLLIGSDIALAEKAVEPSQRHGYRSSKPWLERHPVVTTLTGAEQLAGVALPSAFDWRNVDGFSYITPDLNQHVPIYCGACWIHGTVHALNDRIKVMRKGRFPDIQLSRQAMLNCVPDPSNSGPPPGCNGGDAWMIHQYLHHNKIPDDSCMPYTAQNMECEPVSVCRNCAGKPNPSTGLMVPDYCFPIKHWTGYGVGDYGNVSGEDAMMREIFARGPIVCNAACDDDFMYNYSSNQGVLTEGVYITDKKFTASEVDHVLEVTGWGETPAGTKYWVVRNSWGTYWGDMGWVKIRRGVNQQLFEADCDWAVPEFEDLEVQFKSRVLGDYLSGTRNAGPRKGVGSGDFEALNVARVPLAPNLLSAVLAGVIGVFAGSLFTAFVVIRRCGQRHRQVTQPIPLG